MSARRRTLILFILLFLGMAEFAHADALTDAEKAYYNQQYDTSFDLFKPLAEKGVAEAQEKIGWMYVYGLGTYRSYPDAVDWLTKAANQGVPEATHQVAQMYDLGLGVEKNNMIAYMWYLICQVQLDALDEKPQTYNPKVDISIMSEVMSDREIADAKRLASKWKRLGPDGKPAPFPRKPKNSDQYPLPGPSQ